MATDNEWLRLIYAQLAQNGSGGGATQAQIKEAIETATNLDGIELPLAAIAKATWTSRRLTTASAEYSNPSSGSYVWTVPANQRWQFCQAYISVTTSAVVGSRTIRFGAASGGGWLQLLSVRATQAESLTRQYNLAMVPTDTAFDGGGFIGLTVPPLIIDAGENFTVNLNGIQAADAVTSRIKIVQWNV